MIKKLLLATLLILCLPAFSPADSNAGTGGGCQYLFDTAAFCPEAWLKWTSDLYLKITDKWTFFEENRIFAVYDFSASTLFFLGNLAADFSFLQDFLLARWGLQVDIDYNTGDTELLYNLGSIILLSFGFDTFSLGIKPGITYFNTDRIFLDLEGEINLSFSLFEQIIFSPGIRGGVAVIREAAAEPFYALENELDWYPGVPLTLNFMLGYEEKFSKNEYSLNTEDYQLNIPGYFGYHDLYGSLIVNWLVNDAFSLAVKGFASWKLMKHMAVVPPDLSNQQEWQVTIQPELKLDFTLADSLSLIFTADLIKILSNTAYAEITKAGAGLEVVYFY